MDHCCEKKSSELAQLRSKQAHILKIVLAINLVMFLVEYRYSFIAQSSSLMADSLDMLGDAIVYGFSLYVLHKSDRWRSTAALLKGLIIVGFAISVLVEVWFKIRTDFVPSSNTMGIIGALALAANTACLFLLYRHREDDLNMKSTWICSRNDIISNVGVLIAAVLVYFNQSKWPDIFVGLIIAALFIRSAVPLLFEAIQKIRTPNRP
jgi:cation diffusion facilitator family transporter